MMKKHFLVGSGFGLVLVAALFSSCIKTKVTPPCTGYELTKDQEIIEAALDEMGQKADYTFDTDPQKQVYYNIANPGTGEVTPTTKSEVKLKFYTRILGKTEIIDSLSASEVDKKYVIETLPGLFSYGLLKIKKGGKINIIIPSSRNYSCQEARTSLGKVIPANSQLQYEIQLTDITDIIAP